MRSSSMVSGKHEDIGKIFSYKSCMGKVKPANVTSTICRPVVSMPAIITAICAYASSVLAESKTNTACTDASGKLAPPPCDID